MSEQIETCATCGYERELDRAPHWLRHGFYNVCYRVVQACCIAGALFFIALAITLARA